MGALAIQLDLLTGVVTAAPRPSSVFLEPAALLRELRGRGARRLARVRLRRNRSVLWSLTEGGTTLNLHEAYGAAPPEILDALALLVREVRQGTPEARKAARAVRHWPPVLEALGSVQADSLASMVPCRGTPPEQERIRDLYLRMNRERFRGLLPAGIPLRLSGRMRLRLGHMRPGTGADGHRFVVEIALNHALLVPENAALLEDTLLHEMAHAADWLVDGRAGHGPTWRVWARRAGCQPRACTTLPFRRPASKRTGGRGRGS